MNGKQRWAFDPGGLALLDLYLNVFSSGLSLLQFGEFSSTLWAFIGLAQN